MLTHLMKYSQLILCKTIRYLNDPEATLKSVCFSLAIHAEN